MRRLIERFAELSAGDIGTVLVVGAGQGGLLAPLRRAQPQRLVLAEANPRIAEGLALRLDPARGEEAWSYAITVDAAPSVPLHATNPPAHSGLRAPDRLFREYPNLSAAPVIAVRSRTFADVLGTLALEQDPRRHLLVLDAPGQAFDLLTAVPAARIRSFSAIVVSTAEAPLYDGEIAHEGVVSALGSLGFAVAADDTETIRPHRAVLAIRDDARAARLALEEALGRSSIENARLMKHVEGLQSEFERQAAALSDAADAIRALEADARVLSEERDAALSKTEWLRKELKRHEEASGATRAHLDVVVGERDEALSKAEWLRNELKRHEDESEAAREQGGVLANERDEALSKAEWLRKELKRHEEEFEVTRAHLGVVVGERDEALAQVAKLRADKAQSAEEAASRFATLSDAASKGAEAAEGRIVALVQERDAALSKVEWLRKEMKRQADESEAARTSLGAIVRERDESLRQAGEANAEMQRRAEAGSAKLSQLEADLAGTSKLLKEAIVRAETVQQDREELRKQAGERNRALEATIEAQRQELTQCMQAVSLSVRLQTMREADLLDLQGRHLELKQRSDEQYQVLSKLAERLSAASGYFRQLMVNRATDGSEDSILPAEQAPAKHVTRSHAVRSDQAGRGETAKKAKPKAKTKTAAKEPPRRSPAAKQPRNRKR